MHRHRLAALLILVTVLAFLLSACIVRGRGDTYGYVTTVEEGIWWDKVWLRAELESSQTDCYTVNNDEEDRELTGTMRQLAEQKTRVRMSFDRHLFVVTGCSSDVVTGIQEIQK